MGLLPHQWMKISHSSYSGFRLHARNRSLSFFYTALAGIITLMCAACQGTGSEIDDLANTTAALLQPSTTAPPAIPYIRTASATAAPQLSAPISRPMDPEHSATATASIEITQPITTTLIFTGIIVPARCVQAKIDLLGNPNYPYEEVREILSGADLTVGVFNATMSDRTEPTGCLTTWQLVGRPENADAAAWAGFDLMGVATNHIKDCGLMKSWCDEAFFDTLENLKRVGITPVGAGSSLEEALNPVIIELNGVRFGFISLGDSKMDPIVFAGEDHPGIAELTPDNIRRALDLVRQQADVVIALPHWGSEDNPVPNWNQTQQARLLVAGGADLIVGNHPHVIQAIKEVDETPVFYGLGNFVFDQGLRDHRQGVILLVYFQGSEYAGYKLIPTHTDGDGRIHIAGLEEADEILNNIELTSQKTR